MSISENLLYFKFNLRFAPYTDLTKGRQDMDYQNVFKRYELKYLLDERQRQDLLDRMDGRMKIDSFVFEGATAVERADLRKAIDMMQLLGFFDMEE